MPTGTKLFLASESRPSRLNFTPHFLHIFPQLNQHHGPSSAERAKGTQFDLQNMIPCRQPLPPAAGNFCLSRK
jgi:hypothetical protein